MSETEMRARFFMRKRSADEDECSVARALRCLNASFLLKLDDISVFMPKKQTPKKKGKTAMPKKAKAAREKGLKMKEAKAPQKAIRRKKKILIVEDERPLAHALELKFAHEGFETHIAIDGAEAVEKSKKIKPHVILLDLIMPTVDGFAFLEEMKKAGIKVPVIVLTNLGQDEDRKRATQLGAKGYFVKSNTPIADIVKHVRSSI